VCVTNVTSLSIRKRPNFLLDWGKQGLRRRHIGLAEVHGLWGLQH
jgi:hypothetical protein